MREQHTLCHCTKCVGRVVCVSMMMLSSTKASGWRKPLLSRTPCLALPSMQLFAAECLVQALSYSSADTSVSSGRCFVGRSKQRRNHNNSTYTQNRQHAKYRYYCISPTFEMWTIALLATILCAGCVHADNRWVYVLFNVSTCICHTCPSGTYILSCLTQCKTPKAITAPCSPTQLSLKFGKGVANIIRNAVLSPFLIPKVASVN